MMDFSLMDIIIFFGSILLFVMLLMELLDWFSSFWFSSSCSPVNLPFIYGENCSPRVWCQFYPESRGCEQSPINIISKLTTVIEPSKPLCWKGYTEEPQSMMLINDGNKILLCGVWEKTVQPRLEGGPLKAVYDFSSVEFRWGPSDDEGSEHSIDYFRYPMELQVVHTKWESCLSPPMASSNENKIAIVAYFFQLTAIDNPYLDHVVTNLWHISNPGSSFVVPAFPLDWIVPNFSTNFYTYSGSITQPPCTENVIWIINPEPIAISSQQISQFRKMCSEEGPILSNSRPVQMLNNRQIYYYT